MSAATHAATTPILGNALPKVGNRCASHADAGRFGDLIIVAFLLAQCLDGVFTYVGVMTFGTGIEANPVIAWLMQAFGSGPALTGAKLVPRPRRGDLNACHGSAVVI